MRLKRIYDQSKLKRDKTTGAVTNIMPGAVKGVKVMRIDKGVHHFTETFINAGLVEGWLSMGGGKLTMTADDGEKVSYRIIRTPGIYCCHCDLKLGGHRDGNGPDNKNAQTYLEHVATHKKASPDPNNPSGYRDDNFYCCVNEDKKIIGADAKDLAELEAKIRHGRWTKVGKRKGPKPARISGGADFVFNIAKGAVSLYYQNVDGNNPANSAFSIFVIDANGDTDATMRDRDNVSVLLGGTCNEVTNTNYARKTLTDSDLSAFAPDDGNDRVDLDIPDQTWTAVAAGTAWTDFVTAYDNDTTGGDDTNLTPMTLHDFAVTPDGSDITAQIASAGFFRAS